MSFRQLEQRHISAEIALMEWNPMLDLIALATVNGEIMLHRLSWQKVWSFPSPSTKEKPILVTAMAWRPDGKILAYAYDTGKVTLCDVENSEAVHLLDVHCVVTFLSWVETTENDNPESGAFYNDRSSEYLQKLYAFNKAYGSTAKQVEEVADDFKKMKGQKFLNILAIGMEVGMIHLHSFGMFPSGYLDVNTQMASALNQDRVLSVTLSDDFRVLTVALESKHNNEYFYSFKSYNVPLFYENINELKVVALKYGQISSLLTYLSSTIRAISEAWEDILLEIDTKLHNYAVEKRASSEGTISDDFLELLMFGTPSDALEKFLLHDLTESGLKKFGHSIELSYSNIQKLVLKRLQNVAMSLFYNLNDLKGMAMWYDRFGQLGLSKRAVNDALFSVGSFLLKATEIQQVIDNSMKNFKAFFRWMYVVILRLSDEQIPSEITKVTQQDLNFVAEFLKENFAFEYDQNRKTTVKLERVAQYLKKEQLAYQAVTTGNPWHKFLSDNSEIKASGLIFPYYPEKSLVTQYTDLRKLIDIAVKGPWGVLRTSARLRVSHLIYRSTTPSPPQVSHVSCLKTGFMYTALTNHSPPSIHLYLFREPLKGKKPEDPDKKPDKDAMEAVGLTFNRLQFSTPVGDPPVKLHKILDIKFYDSETLTVLLLESSHSDNNCPILLQMPIRPLLTEMKPVQSRPNQSIIIGIPVVDAGLFIEKVNYKRLENIKALKIAVSGSRKVVCVLFASRRQVRLFEMDVEVEDEEDEDLETEHEDSVMKDSAAKDSSFENEDDSPSKQDKENSF